MSPFALGLAGFGVLILLLALRAPIALATAVTGLGGVWLLRDHQTVLYLTGTVPREILENYALSTLPLFILMGNVAASSGLSTALFDAFNALVGRRRGGLAVATVLTSGALSAASGSSLAMTSTMARMAAPEMLSRRYHPRLVCGTIAAGGTLGIMIPPSTMLIIYGYLTETSIGALFVAGLVPGLLLVAGFALTVAVWARLRPGDAGRGGDDEGGKSDMGRLLALVPVLALFGVLLGGIYGGLFTPTEGAAVGAGAAIVIAAVIGKLTLRRLRDALFETARTSAVIYLIIIGTAFFQFFMEASRVPVQAAGAVSGLGLPAPVVMLIIMALIALLGCIMEGLGIMFLTVPILFPIVTAIGYDPVWFGIVMVLLIELGLITPPVGMNIFVLVSQIPELRLRDVFVGVLPFVVAIVAVALALLAVPDIALFLPATMR
ncbi:TRAP transporter large permease [Pseudoruegeria sp. HB172150]|uniref:TRAP transporter large permease n=1 Tax=Pseudoruegeria sp. HB172150 TaxID=2721164 RepID=UPI0015575E63|nr:TRAP transporter large permease [Pseudoruegeria sp. HB172150]